MSKTYYDRDLKGDPLAFMPPEVREAVLTIIKWQQETQAEVRMRWTINEPTYSFREDARRKPCPALNIENLPASYIKGLLTDEALKKRPPGSADIKYFSTDYQVNGEEMYVTIEANNRSNRRRALERMAQRGKREEAKSFAEQLMRETHPLERTHE